MARQLVLVAVFALLVGSFAATPYPGLYGITLTNEQWQYNWAPCNDTSGNVVGLTNEQCRQCMVDAAATSYTMLDKSYACHSQCSSKDYFATTGPKAVVTGVKSAAAGAQDCVSCVTSANVNNAWGCTFCMQNTLNLELRAECFDCVKSANATLSSNNTYLYACTMCTVISDAIAKAKCQACIASGSDTKDYGKCVADAQKLEQIAQGLAVPEGIEQQCYVAPTAAMSNMTCARCMNNTMANHPNGTFAYGCAAYCQKASTSSLAGACATCLASANTYDAWGCSNCLQSGNPTQCYTCLETNPYGGKASNYGWACGSCANIDDSSMRAACFYCVENQGTFNNMTESNICACIDLTTNVGIQFNGDGILSGLTGLDAMERSCFVNHSVTGPAGTSVNLPLAWPGTSCLQCMKDTTFQKRYACNQYCQDPRLILDTDSQGSPISSMEGSSSDGWTTVYARGAYGNLDLGPDETSTLFADAPNKIFRRLCNRCTETHKIIFYKRISPIPPAPFSIHAQMLNVWSSVNNQHNFDFQLYSTYVDARAGVNPWKFCNFDDPRVAFPRDCGPVGPVPFMWTNNFPQSTDISYAVETALARQGNDCAACVVSSNVKDPYSCQYCMIKSYANDTAIRKDCFKCTKDDDGAFPNYGWACGECAGIANDTARRACLRCVNPVSHVVEQRAASGYVPARVSPSQCVNAAKSWPYHVNSSYTDLGCRAAATTISKFVMERNVFRPDINGPVTADKCAMATKAHGFKEFFMTYGTQCHIVPRMDVAVIVALAPATDCFGNGATAHFYVLL